MKRILLLILLAVISSQSTLAQDYGQAIAKARFLLKNHQKQTNIPGMQVAVIVGGSLVWSESFGYSNLDKLTPVDSTTKFRIASVSKSVTSIALGRMIERKEIDIDKDIRYYLPEFPEKEFEITARQLASSTAGIRHYTSIDPKYNSINYEDVKSSLVNFENDPLLFEPGTDYHYSSYGWVLLSAAMEKAAGKSFFQIMEETWKRLGMYNTSFDYPNDKKSNVSEFYIHAKNNSRVLAPKDNRSYIYAGGGYLSTALDLARMGSKLISNEYLDKKTIDEIFTAQRLKDGKNTYYGLGWETGVSRIGTPIVYHSGSMSSARSHLVIYPKKEVVFAYVANTGDHVFFNDREAQNIAEIFVNESKANEVKNKSEFIGKWEISTTSLRGKKTEGVLDLQYSESDIVTGELIFTRSKKKEAFPVALTKYEDDQIHLIAVSPMYIDLFITTNGNAFTGEWLHDFNVKGVLEEDEYWEPRVIVGEKKSSSKE